MKPRHNAQNILTKREKARVLKIIIDALLREGYVNGVFGDKKEEKRKNG